MISRDENSMQYVMECAYLEMRRVIDSYANDEYEISSKYGMK
jgi:hypothetical protein